MPSPSSSSSPPAHARPAALSQTIFVKNVVSYQILNHMSGGSMSEAFHPSVKRDGRGRRVWTSPEFPSHHPNLRESNFKVLVKS
eukprot:766900-Hanusia_phi.AAC.3